MEKKQEFLLLHLVNEEMEIFCNDFSNSKLPNSRVFTKLVRKNNHDLVGITNFEIMKCKDHLYFEIWIDFCKLI